MAITLMEKRMEKNVLIQAIVDSVDQYHGMKSGLAMIRRLLVILPESPESLSWEDSLCNILLKVLYFMMILGLGIKYQHTKKSGRRNIEYPRSQERAFLGRQVLRINKQSYPWA